MLGIWLFLCISGCIVLAALPFLNLPILDTNIEFISGYGAYLAGTVAPFIALFAFLGILQTLRLQYEQIEKLTVENKKQEISRCLEKLEILIQEELSNHNISIEAQGDKYTLSQVLNMLYFQKTYTQVVKQRDQYIDRECNTKLGSKDIQIFEAVGSASLYVLRMSEYLGEYDKLESNGYSKKFYYNKYSTLANRLYDLGFLEEREYALWKPKT